MTSTLSFCWDTASNRVSLFDFLAAAVSRYEWPRFAEHRSKVQRKQATCGLFNRFPLPSVFQHSDGNFSFSFTLGAGLSSCRWLEQNSLLELILLGRFNGGDKEAVFLHRIKWLSLRCFFESTGPLLHSLVNGSDGGKASCCEKVVGRDSF